MTTTDDGLSFCFFLTLLRTAPTVNKKCTKLLNSLLKRCGCTFYVWGVDRWFLKNNKWKWIKFAIYCIQGQLHTRWEGLFSFVTIESGNSLFTTGTKAHFACYVQWVVSTVEWGMGFDNNTKKKPIEVQTTVSTIPDKFPVSFRQENDRWKLQAQNVRFNENR